MAMPRFISFTLYWSVLAVFIRSLSVQAATLPPLASTRAVQTRQADANCFPLGAARFDETNKPSVSSQDWWCSPSQQYGFLGFSYPLENADCNHPSNSLEKISKDFARMKHQFGATMVRIYAPQCRDASVWWNLLQAGITNQMAVLPQVWWGFDKNQDLWKLTANAILSVLSDPDLGQLAPYVFHSIAFGSEPIGDSVDGGSDQFIADLRHFKSRVAPYGIPVTISEDWDRPGIMSGSNGDGLGPVGQQIASVVDLLHVHIMPYYHGDRYPTADNVFPYFQSYVPFLVNNLPGKQIIISQTLWSSVLGGSHDRGWGNPGENIGNFTEYWNTLQYNCDFFKQYRVGWFAHTYDDSQEIGLGMLDGNARTKMYFKPPRC